MGESSAFASSYVLGGVLLLPGKLGLKSIEWRRFVLRRAGLDAGDDPIELVCVGIPSCKRVREDDVGTEE